MTIFATDAPLLPQPQAEPPRTRHRLLKIFILCSLTAITVIAIPFLWRAWVERHFAASISTIETVKPERVAIVYGARVYGEGRLSAMVRDRVDTAIALYQAGKVDKLLMSGSNQNEEYNEPGDMITYALSRGMPADAMQPDFGGRRTYDTCYRAREIFGVNSAILVTQEFHLPRALFTCQALGMQVQGVVADQRTYSERSIRWSEAREIPATIVALLDVLRRQPPPIMGDPIPFS
jgi:SanA protein